MNTVEVSTVDPERKTPTGLKNPWVIGIAMAWIGYVVGVASAERPVPLATPPAANLEAITNRVAVLEQRVKISSATLGELASKVGTYDVGELDLTQKGFARIDSNSVTFFVSVLKVEPYLSGYKITLNIGNPSMASFDGLALAFVYGDSDKPPSEWQTKTISTAATIAAGAWTKVEATLAPATADTLKHVSLEIKTSALSLRRTAGTF